jgi:hypothetical protein
MSSSKESSTKRPSNYYFIEEEVAPLILEWQKYFEKQQEIDNFLEKANDENSEIEIPDVQKDELIKERNKLIEDSKLISNDIMREALKVIKGVIFKAQFHKRERYDTCLEIATEACMKALKRFNPNEGTAFNYLSITAKNSIRFHLIKKAKKKKNFQKLSIDQEYLDDENLQLKNLLKHEEQTLRNLEIENLTTTIFNMLDESNEKKSLTNVAKELREYLFYSEGKYDKKDFFKWAKSDGISSNLLRKFVKFLKENRDQLYEEVGVY